MNEIEQYIHKRITSCGHVDPALYERYMHTPLETALPALILRKPYRKWKAGSVFEQRIVPALEYSLVHKKPLLFRYWFGGYKLWRFERAPLIDWAEVWALAYYCEYLAPIAALHPYGVTLEFCSDEVFVERLNNIPQKDTEAYTRSFQALIALFQKTLPEKLRLQYSLNRNLWTSPESFEQDFYQTVEALRPGWKQKRSPEVFERDLASSWLNISFEKGSVAMSNFSEAEKRAKAEESLLLHDALGILENPKLIDARPDVLSIFAHAFPDSLGLGTTKNSMVKFWVGTGVLERVESSFQERILSFQQSVKSHNVASKSVSVASFEDTILPNTISVFEKPFDFSRS